MNDFKPADPNLMVLSSLFTSATEHASVAMDKWTNGNISLSLDELREVALEDVTDELDIGDELFTMVVLNLEGELGGQLILTFDEENGRQLAASLLGREPNTDPEWSPLEKSALNETGNILACAYMTVLTEVIAATLVPSPPFFIQDYGASVLQQAVMTQAMVSDRVLICRTIFQRGDEILNWNIFFVPTEELLAALENAVETIT
jgi:chemotaxis protein CheC